MHHCLNPLNFKDFKIYILINKLFNSEFKEQNVLNKSLKESKKREKNMERE